MRPSLVFGMSLLMVWSLPGEQSGGGASAIGKDFDPTRPAPIPRFREFTEKEKQEIEGRSGRMGLTTRRQAQSGGITSISAVYDPTKPSNPVSFVQTFFRKHLPLPIEEYQRRKAQIDAQRRPDTFGPPMLEVQDYAAQRAPVITPRQPLALAATTKFEANPQSLNPPDPDMAAGPEDLLTVINATIARSSKSGQQTSIQTLQQWFANLIPTICPSGGACNFFDPIIRYDSLHGRFLLSAISEDALTLRTYFVLSVSNGATFAGGWKNWGLAGSLNGTQQSNFELDFTQMGYDNNCVYLASDMYNVFSGVLQYAKLRILKKSELYNAATTALTYQDIWDLKNEDNTKAVSLQPAILRGRTGTGTPPGIVVNAAVDTPNADYLTVWRIENPTSATPAATRTTVRGLWRYDLPGTIPQLGTQWRLNAGLTSVLKAVLRNNILYTARNTGYSNEPVTVTYDRIDLTSNKVTLQARHTNGNFFYPAFDVPASHGPTNAVPNKLIVGTTTDAAGGLTYPGLSDVKAGEDFFTAGDRWGDYFGGAVDPILGGLWTFGQYAKPKGTSGGRYGTYAGYFPAATSPQFTDVPSTSFAYDAANTLRLWSITLGCNTALYCPADSVTRGQVATFVIRALLGDTFTFPAQPYFTDVPATHPFFSQIQKFRELGFTSGCGTGTTFCPDVNVTRGEMAVFLTRGKMFALQADTFAFPQTAFFTDVPATHVYYKWIQKLRDLGVTQGCGTTTYCPDDNVTREQMAAFLVRAFLN